LRFALVDGSEVVLVESVETRHLENSLDQIFVVKALCGRIE
jgi:hypothetical protein